MSAHTPGPWIHSTDLGQIGSVETPDGVVVAQAQQIMRGAGDLQLREANARLIAAAPELLEALRSLIGWIPNAQTLERMGFHTKAPMESYELARKAIAKATGAA